MQASCARDPGAQAPGARLRRGHRRAASTTSTIDRLAHPASASSSSSPGPSGSGKSSLAFDTLYAEGQRRYVETLSAYARQFLGQLDRAQGRAPRGPVARPSPSSRRAPRPTPRSTVGTITEIYDYLRVLYAQASASSTARRAARRVAAQGARSRSSTRVLAPRRRGRRLTALRARSSRTARASSSELFEELLARGFARVEVDGQVVAPDDEPDARQEEEAHRLRSSSTASSCARPTARASPRAWSSPSRGEGRAARSSGRGGASRSRSASARACCGVAFPELSPQSFSFNSPLGMCPACNGLGSGRGRPGSRRPRRVASIREGAIAPWATRMARGEGWTVAHRGGGREGVRRRSRTCRGRSSRGEAAARALRRRSGGEKIAIRGARREREPRDVGDAVGGRDPDLERRFRETSLRRGAGPVRRYLREQPCDACGGRAPAAGDARRAARRQEHRRRRRP